MTYPIRESNYFDGCKRRADDLDMFIDYQYVEQKRGVWPLYVATTVYEKGRQSALSPFCYLYKELLDDENAGQRCDQWAQNWRKKAENVRLRTEENLVSDHEDARWDRMGMSYSTFVATCAELYEEVAKVVSTAVAAARRENYAEFVRIINSLREGGFGSVGMGPRRLWDIAARKTEDRRGSSKLVLHVRRCDACGIYSLVLDLISTSDGNLCTSCVGSLYDFSEIQQSYVRKDRSVPVYATEKQAREKTPIGFVERASSPRVYTHEGVTYRYLTSARMAVSMELFMAWAESGTLANYGENPIGSYHSSKAIIGKPILGRCALPLLGMELEVEDMSGDSSKQKAATHVITKLSPRGNQIYCSVERDGSLRNGFEIVTAPCTLDVHADQLKGVFQLKEFANLRSHDTDTCGLHVHVDKAGTTAFHRGKMVSFINDEANKPLVMAVARRYKEGSGYAVIRKKKMTQHQSSDRYEAVNLVNEHTIEFRIFRGTLRYESIMACLEFTRAVWFFTRNAGATELTTKRFLSWIDMPENKSDTRNLRQILVEKKLLSGENVLREMSGAIDR